MNQRMKKELVRTLEKAVPEYLPRERRPHGLQEWVNKVIFRARYAERYPTIEIPEATVVAAIKLPRKGGYLIDELAVFERIVSHDEIRDMLPKTGRGWHAVYFQQRNRVREYYINGEAVSLDHYYPKEGEKYANNSQDENGQR